MGSGRRMEKHFGAKMKTILGGDFNISRDDRPKCRIRLVRVGAACDYAQRRKGPIPFLLAAEIPCGTLREHLQGSEWRSPILVANSDEGPFTLVVNSRFLTTVPEEAAQGWQVCYRLREQILMHLIGHAGHYVTRPGIVST